MTKEQEIKLICKVGVFGLSDLNRLAPIGNLGYMNGWYPPLFCKSTWADTELPRAIYGAFQAQRKHNKWTIESNITGYRQTDHHYYCPELDLRWNVDSGD